MATRCHVTLLRHLMSGYHDDAPLEVKVTPFTFAGGTSAVASRALSVQNMNYNDSPTNKGNLEHKELEDEIVKVDKMINDMEMKVNVLRWTVEANASINDELVNNEVSSVALLSMEEGESRNCCNGREFFVSWVLCGLALIAVTLSICAVNMA
ncbi:hypothetical protein FKM82_006402 [Ascaphus truei]